MRNPRLFTLKEVIVRAIETRRRGFYRRTCRRWNRLKEVKRACVKPTELYFRAYQAVAAGMRFHEAGIEDFIDVPFEH